MESLFYLHALLAIIAMAFAMIIPHTVHALLSMIASLLCLSICMYLLSAPLAASLEVIVYAGAIMVLFAFCIMLLQIAPPNQKFKNHPTLRMFFAFLVFVIFWGELTFVLQSSSFINNWQTFSLQNIAEELFIKHGFIIELVSMLLLSGLAAAIYVGSKLLKRIQSLTRENI